MHVGDFQVPVQFDGLTLVAGLFAVLALAAAISGVVQMVRDRRLRVLRLGGGLVLLLIGLLVFAVAGWAQTYRTLTRAELVATIRAVPTGSQLMSVTYTPVEGGKPGTPQTFAIHGDKWELGGDVIKWQDWVNILGVHTGYRITRLDGYYVDHNDYYRKPLSFIDLGGHTSTVEQFVRDHGNLLPFVRATYGNAVNQVPSAAATYQVYLSTSGYWTATPG